MSCMEYMECMEGYFSVENTMYVYMSCSYDLDTLD